MAESEKELKSLLMKVKDKSQKVGLKLNTQKNKIMASSSTTSWYKDRETRKTLTHFIFLGFKITQMVAIAVKLEDTCSLEVKL